MNNLKKQLVFVEIHYAFNQSIFLEMHLSKD